VLALCPEERLWSGLYGGKAAFAWLAVYQERLFDLGGGRDLSSLLVSRGLGAALPRRRLT
jgi:hypothetical protein